MWGRAVLNIAIITILLCGLRMSALMGQGPNVPATLSLGQEPYGAYSSSATETVNLYNGNVNVVINLLSLKGRNGQDINVTLAYNSKQIVKIPTVTPGVYQYDWAYQGPTQGLWVLNSQPQKTTVVNSRCNTATNNFDIKPAYLITMPDGGVQEMHPLQAPYYDDWITTNTPCIFSAPSWSGDARSITGTVMEYRNTNNSLYLKNGNRIDFTTASAVKVIDTNGNITTYNIDTTNKRPTRVDDNLGRMINFWYDDGVNLTRVTVNGVNGTQTYTFGYTTLHVNTYLTEFSAINGCLSVGRHQDVTVLQSITLPNGLAYTFTYDQGPYESSNVCPSMDLWPPHNVWTSTLKLVKITYPAGGYTRYVHGFVRTIPLPPGVGTIMCLRS